MKTLYTFALSGEEAGRLERVLAAGPYAAKTVPYARVAAAGEGVSVVLYESGKLVVQGKNAAGFVEFALEPLVLLRAETALAAQAEAAEDAQPHMGVDESGKGDFFGPLVIAAAYTDAATAPVLREMGVKDSKAVASDAAAKALAKKIRETLGDRFAVVTVPVEAYNRLHAKTGNINRLLGWGHARAIENLLSRVPDCPRALCDQFGPKAQIVRSLMPRGRKIVLDARPKAESDIAVAAASILAREAFLRNLEALSREAGIALPKGAGPQVKTAAEAVAAKLGAESLGRFVKCHFKTLDEVLAKLGTTRAAAGLPPAPPQRLF